RSTVMSHFLVFIVYTFLISALLFFFTAPATTEIYTLSLHDALPICGGLRYRSFGMAGAVADEFTGSVHYHLRRIWAAQPELLRRSEEHTSELQSLAYLVCRLLLEKKKIHQHKVPLRPSNNSIIEILC